jgi:hypothetical protein
MREICASPNVLAYCFGWQTKKPKLFNKFMELCALYKEDDSYIDQRVTATEFMWNKRLKKDVLIGSDVIDGKISCWDEDSHMWYREKATNLSEPKEIHQ